MPIHGSLKRKRGVGEHAESSRLDCLSRLRLLRPPIALPSNPLLALQASSRFELLGDLEVRVPNEVSGQQLKSPPSTKVVLRALGVFLIVAAAYLNATW